MKKTKTPSTYRVRNWSQYTQSLRRRASLTLWLDESAFRSWYAPQATTAVYGRPKLFSDIAILTALTVAQVFHLPLRQTQGFLASVVRLLDHAELRVPDYTTLCKRRMNIQLPVLPKAQREALHAVIDSTGLKVYGDGEWKVRQHGYSKRRTWRKLHLIVDAHTHEIVTATLTNNQTHDGQVLPSLLSKIVSPVKELAADGAYDQRSCYEALSKRGVRALIAPRHNAKIWKHGNSRGAKHIRDENVRRIRKVGRKVWKIESGYHQRSLAETAMYRYKMIFGERLHSRNDRAQYIEAMICCNALNRMTKQGMPISVKIT